MPDAKTVSCTPTECAAIPADQCVDGNTLRVHDHQGPGHCDADEGRCVYAHSDIPCHCVDNACVDRPAVGEQRTAVILIDFIGDGKQQSVDTIRQAVFTAERSINRFYQEASYGRTWLSGDVYGWYSVSNSVPFCKHATEDLLAIAAQDLPSYLDIDRFVLLLRAPIDGCEDAGLGQSSFGKVDIRTPDGTVNASVLRSEIDYRLARPKLPHQDLSYITASVIAHELGHSFGLRGHANLLDCGRSTISTAAEPCQQEAIADMFSVMSGEGFPRAGLHFRACHKEDLGWFLGEELRTVLPDNLAGALPLTVRLHPYEERTSPGAVALRIPLPTPIAVTEEVSISELFIENRTTRGFDGWIGKLTKAAGLTYHQMTSVQNPSGDVDIDVVGVQILGGFFKDGHCVTTYLMDAHPDSLQYEDSAYSLYDALDSFLNVGETLVEPHNGFSVTVTESFADGSVELRIDGA